MLASLFLSEQELLFAFGFGALADNDSRGGGLDRGD